MCQLVSTTNSLIASIDRGVSMHVTVLDFSKAFDRVSHGLLIDKLHDIGIDTLIIEWISNFLSNRYQMVVINGDSTSPLAVTSGVPQSSVLGPSLFLVYVNDIGSSLRHSSIGLFADDALLYCLIQNTGDMVSFQWNLSSLEQ